MIHETHAMRIMLVSPKSGVGETRVAANLNSLRLRWDGDAQTWRDLFVAVVTDDEAALDEVRLHAKLLFCGDLTAWGWRVLSPWNPQTTGQL